MTLNLRLAKLNDALAVGTIQIASWRSAYRGIVPDAVLDTLSESAHEALWRMTIVSPKDDDALWVADDAGEVVGFCFTRRSDEADAAADAADLSAIYLAPDRIGHGVGRQLFERSLNHLRVQGFREATLWVFADNERARRFYDLAGWIPDGAERRKQRGEASPLELRYRINLDSAGEAATS